MKYVVIDFETANGKRNSACSIGMVKVNNGEIIDTFYSLINPKELFDDFNIFLHGITPENVENSPTFPEIWPNIKSFIDDYFIIAHNASFDMSVLRHTLDKYQLQHPELQYSCSRILSKCTWSTLINYKLDTLAQLLNIEFQHHTADEDARATSMVFEAICKQNNCFNIEDLHSLLHINIGNINCSGYKPACINSRTTGNSVNKQKLKASDIVATSAEIDDSHPLYKKTVVFTGTLSSMQRKDAMQLVVNTGGLCGDRITHDSNFLVMGIQDYSKFADGKKSSKLKLAEKYISEGSDLEIIDEATFLQLI